MDSKLYWEISRFIQNYRGPSRHCLKELKIKYPQISSYTIGSICSLHYQNKMKIGHHKIVAKAKEIHEIFKAAMSEGQKPGIILRIAETMDLCPSLIARAILEKHYEERDEKVTKSFITSLLKDTTLIEDGSMAYEIYLCIMRDDQYGSIPDIIRHCIGLEYEDRLKMLVKENGLPFRDEENLRARGYDKTPDVKLEIPFAVDGFIVNWIESKALFADTRNHEQYMKSQYLSYWNRFGPGLVIYWFGYIDEVLQKTEKKIIVRDSFPENITFMDPSLVPALTLV